MFLTLAMTAGVLVVDIQLWNDRSTKKFWIMGALSAGLVWTEIQLGPSNYWLAGMWAILFVLCFLAILVHHDVSDSDEDSYSEEDESEDLNNEIPAPPVAKGPEKLVKCCHCGGPNTVFDVNTARCIYCNEPVAKQK